MEHHQCHPDAIRALVDWVASVGGSASAKRLGEFVHKILVQKHKKKT